MEIHLAMGHNSLETTMGYLHAESLNVKSPLESVLAGKKHQFAVPADDTSAALARHG